MFIRKHFQTPQKALIKCCLNWGCSYLDVDPWQRKFFHSLRYCVGKDETGKENNMTLLWQPNHGKRVHLHFYSNNEVSSFSVHFQRLALKNDSKNLRFLGGLHGSIHRGKAGWNKWKNNWKCFIVKTVQWIIQTIQSSFHMHFFRWLVFTV